MDSIIEKKKNFIISFAYSAIFVCLYYFTIKYAFGYIFPFLFAAALAVFLQRPINAIKKKLRIKAHSAVSVFLVLLIVVLIIGGLSLGFLALFNELRDFFSYMISQFTSVSDLIKTIEEFVMGFVVKLPGSLEGTIGVYVSDFFAKLGTQSSGFDFSMLSAPIQGAWSVVKGIPSIFLSVIVTVISCVFMTSDYESIRDMLLGMFTKEKRAKLVNAKRTVTKGVSKLVKAYATIMLITFTEMFIGLSFMKLIGVYNGGYIAIIAFVTCIVDIIPVFGTGTIILPWAVYLFISGNYGLGIGLIILYGVITVLRQVIEPKLVASQVGLPAIATIMAMFIGARVFGTFGIIILPLTVVVLKLMYDEGVIGNKALIEGAAAPAENDLQTEKVNENE